jgi:hypothetical protein
MAPVRILVLTAVLPEARALARAFRLREAKTAEMPLWIREEMCVALVGIRARQLGKLENVSEVADAQLIIMAGVGGALSPALEVGDVVVEPRGSSVPLPPLGSAFLGRVLSEERIVGSPREKARLFRQSGCLAVDMETAVVAQFAGRRGAAFLAVRGISDTAHEHLDPALLALVGPEGYPRISQAIATLLRHPRTLAPMLRLHRATANAMTSVANTLALLIASGWPGRAAERPGET